MRKLVSGVVTVAATMLLPTYSAAAEFRKDGVVWELRLSHDEVVKVEAAGTAAALNLDPGPSKAVALAIGVLVAVDNLGEQKGVCVTGTFGSTATVVTPPDLSPYGELVKLGKGAEKGLEGVQETLAKAGGDVSDEWKRFADRTGIWKKKKDPKLTYGKLVANRVRPSLVPDNTWERFTILCVEGPKPNDRRIVVHSYAGYMRHFAENQDQVRCDAPLIGQQEKWELVRHNDGTYSFRSFNGKYLRWGVKRDFELDVAAGPVNDNMKFHIRFNSDGTVGIYRHDGNPRTHCWLTVQEWEVKPRGYDFQTADR